MTRAMADISKTAVDLKKQCEYLSYFLNVPVVSEDGIFDQDIQTLRRMAFENGYPMKVVSELASASQPTRILSTLINETIEPEPKVEVVDIR
jgi:hypothetical protein